MSDGQYSPREVVRLAKEKGIELLAITDHDTVAGIAEGAAAAKEAGIAFIPGIEISVKANSELHMLGYCLDAENAELLEMSAEFVRLRALREARIYDFLHARGVRVTKEQVRRHVKGGVVGRPHFARAIVEAGFASDVGEAFRKYLATPDFQSVERPKLAAEKGVSLIRRAGGVAVLAHPSTLRLGPGPLEEMVARLAGAGMQGIECHYSTNTEEQTRLYLSLAKKYRLAVTGGSDFHGEAVKKEIELGSGIGGSLRFDDMGIGRRLSELAAANRKGGST
jgi:predicted metal-dependent phosphoesterase TrpH